MHNNISSDRRDAVIKTLMYALIEVSCIAEMAHKHACRESEYAGAVIPHSLAFIHCSTEQALRQVRELASEDMTETSEGANHA